MQGVCRRRPAPHAHVQRWGQTKSVCVGVDGRSLEAAPRPPSTCTAVAMVLGLGGATWWWFYTKKDLEQKQGEGERSGGALKRDGGAQCTTANLKGGTAAAPELHCCRGRIQGSPAVPGLPSLHHSGSRGQVW